MDYMSTEKEYNGNLFDQLSLLEDIESALKQGGEKAAMEMIATKRRQIERKLYQQPPIIENR